MYKEEENIEPEFMKRPGTNPFRTPEGYFDSLEDRIMKEIQLPGKKKTTSARIFRILKPAIGIAASITLVYLLVYYPITNFMQKSIVKSEVSDTTTSNLIDDSTLNFAFIDESTLLNAIFTEETSNIAEINPDEMLAYLSSGMNDLEIYSEIQK